MLERGRKYAVHPCYASSRSGHNAIIYWLSAHGVPQVGNCENGRIDKGTYKKKSGFILVVRDPFNCFASWVKSIRENSGKRKNPANHARVNAPEFAEGILDLVETWKSIAREFCGRTDFLRDQFIGINYNRWHVDTQYRQQIIESFGLPFTDVVREDMPPRTWHSSFDGSKFRGRASQLQTLDRWQLMREDPLYIHMLNDAEVVDLSREIFGFAPPEIVELLSNA